MLEIIDLRKDVFKIRYNNATIGVIEKKYKYGNVMYYCHFYWVSATYNNQQDAIAHLLWKSGLTITEANNIAGITV